MVKLKPRDSPKAQVRERISTKQVCSYRIQVEAKASDWRERTRAERRSLRLAERVLQKVNFLAFGFFNKSPPIVKQ